MIALNEKFGFKVLRSSEGYYSSPSEATVVMELRLA
jgi:ribosomal protein S18 acetylase RimI-like enzyme